MLGAMQDWDLLVTHVIDHAARESPTREIVTHWADGSETRTNWAGIRRDALKMAQALEALGIQKGDREASSRQGARNFMFFDAPVGLAFSSSP